MTKTDLAHKITDRPRQILPLRFDPFHYASINELRRHVRDWLIAYNFAKQLKALKFRTPYEAIEELWQSKPDVFIVKPNHYMLGLNNYSKARRAVSLGSKIPRETA